jgi:hypothetical protein
MSLLLSTLILTSPLLLSIFTLLLLISLLPLLSDFLISLVELGFLVDDVVLLGFLLLVEALDVDGRLACFVLADLFVVVGLDVAGLAAGLELPPGLFCACASITPNAISAITPAPKPFLTRLIIMIQDFEVC